MQTTDQINKHNKQYQLKKYEEHLIPLWGDKRPEQGKAPAVRWQIYTTQRPDDDLLARWFSGKDAYSAYGVICGTETGLCVLDFDHPALITHFATAFPHLMQTFSVRTGGRGGLHLYWRTPEPVASRAFKGADFKGRGGYVVGPGSRIAGGVWVVENALPILEISTAELTTVLDWLATETKTNTQPAGRFDHLLRPPALRVQTVPVNPAYFLTQYRQLVDASGERNNSLFAVACQMRDAGHSEYQALQTLLDEYVADPPRMGQAQEAAIVRRREAEATIASAFSRPARDPAQRIGVGWVYADADGTLTSRLPNSLRESLLRRAADGPALLRVLEGLALADWQPGDTFTRGQAWRALRGVVGEHSVHVALSATNKQGARLFVSPLHPPAAAGASGDSTRGAVAGTDAAGLEANRELVADEDAASGGTPAVGTGRRGHMTQANEFVMPTLSEIFKWLNIQPVAGRGDPIYRDDLVSVSAYKQALHRALLERRPAAYPVQWLAQRVNVVRRTLQRYQVNLGVSRLDRYEAIPVTASVAAALGTRAAVEEGSPRPPWGRFLEDENGKRYPPYREVAEDLLRQGRQLQLKQQLANYCHLPADASAETAATTESAENAEKTAPDTPLATSVDVGAPAAASADKPTPEKPPQPAAPADDAPATTQRALLPDMPDRKPPPPPNPDTQPFPDVQSEAAARHTRERIQGLKLTEARKLVRTYGAATVRAMADKVYHLAQAGRVLYPKAYLLKALAQNAQRPQAAPEKASKRQYRQPLPDAKQEQAAEQLRDGLPGLVIFNARRLVVTYGVAVALRTLGRVQWYIKQGYKIRNVAGFFITKIRQVYRELHPEGRVPEFEAEPKRKPRRRPEPTIEEQLAKMPESYHRWRAEFMGQFLF